MHIDRPVGPVEHWTNGVVDVAGPGDERLGEATAAIVGGVGWDAKRFDLAPNLLVLARTGIGFDAVDLDAATKRGVMVVNTPDGPSVSTAEHTAALLLSVAKTIGVHQQRLREASGSYHTRSEGIELHGLTFGVLGFGRIGTRVARIAAGLGMKVIACDPYIPGEALQANDVEPVSFEQLLERSDVVSLHAPLTSETRNLFDDNTFNQCKPGAIFLNAARGGLVDHDSLVRALDDGRLRGAGLDVTDPEPLDPSHTLLTRTNVVVTPHVASGTQTGRDRMLSMAIERALAAMAGERPDDLLNPAVLEQG